MGAVSGEAAERPMEPEAVRASPCVFAVPISPGLYWERDYAEDCVALGQFLKTE